MSKPLRIFNASPATLTPASATSPTSIDSLLDAQVELEFGSKDSLDVISQVKLAAKHRLSAAFGALIGGFVPVGTYLVGHLELPEAGWESVKGAMVLGGLVFSALTVGKWGQRAFNNTAKAVGFVVLCEGIMTFSSTRALGIGVLVLLAAINAIANGANLAIDHLETLARQARTRRARAEDAARVAPAASASAAEVPAPAITVPASVTTVPASATTVPASTRESLAVTPVTSPSPDPSTRARSISRRPFPTRMSDRSFKVDRVEKVFPLSGRRMSANASSRASN